MAIDFCALCNDPCTGANAIIGNNNMQEQWRTLVAQALCGLVSNNPDVVEATQLPVVSKTAAQITASYSTYASSGFLDSELKVRRLTATNLTDADIEVSLDGGTTTHFIIPANTLKELSVGNHVFDLITDLQIRKVSGQTATLGNFYLEGGY